MVSNSHSVRHFVSTKAGGFARLREGNMVEVDVGAGLMVFGKDALADFTRLIDGALRQQDDNLAEFRIGALTDQIRYAQVGTELALEFLGLDLQTARADNAVLAAEDTEMGTDTEGTVPV